ncbi:sensor histidine kinase [Govanella unica]|uniref:histidine kinase n=1 Tax=Govanella unica TaxID=2975056 RepID=A0A9X3Z7E9_9PROT|nr:sensor histidine kinase [Govania unica]MDA5193909.1 sensor histidine kinase [Govania unica]
MNFRSLRLRLLIGGAIAIFAALAVAWGVMTWLFERHIERRVEEDLRRQATQLLAGLVVDPQGTFTLLRKPQDSRFETPASGLYWQVTTKTETRRSRSLWDAVLPSSPSAATSDWQTRKVIGPFSQHVFVLERIIRPTKDVHDILLQVAQDQHSLQIARDQFGRELAYFLALLWLVLSGAAFMQVQLGLRPLGHLRSELSDLKRNPARRLNARYPQEVEPLIAAINDLADAREADLKRARQRAADLAHGMKTPLAALAAQTRLIRDHHAPNNHLAFGMERAIAAATAAVETELARARAAASRNHMPTTDAVPRDICQRLITVLERTEKGMRLDYTLDLDPALRLSIAPEDLNEILGPLLENAVKFARRRIAISGHAKAGKISLIIEDDGPGITAARAAEALSRGGRLDETGHSGHGLGLAIARDLVEATGGTITLGRSTLGGLRIDLRW